MEPGGGALDGQSLDPRTVRDLERIRRQTRASAQNTNGFVNPSLGNHVGRIHNGTGPLARDQVNRWSRLRPRRRTPPAPPIV